MKMTDMIDDIRSIIPNDPSVARMPLKEGQVWFPHYSKEMKEVLMTTPLLRKCRPVYVIAINGDRVTAAKVKTLHDSKLIKDSSVLLKDTGGICRMVECDEICTLPISDFYETDAKYLYEVSSAIQIMVRCTCAQVMGIMYTVTPEEFRTIQQYQQQLKHQHQVIKEPESVVVNAPVEPQKDAQPSLIELPKETPKETSPVPTQMDITSVIKYIEGLNKKLKLAPNRSAFTTSDDGYLEDTGAVAIATSIHKSLYQMMIDDGVLPKIGYYRYRNIMTSSSAYIVRKIWIGDHGCEKCISITTFPSAKISK